MTPTMDKLFIIYTMEKEFATPAKAASVARGTTAAVAAAVSTPGGFQLFDFINGLQASPFVTKASAPMNATSTATATPLRTPASNRRRQSPSRTGALAVATTPRNRIEWHACQLDSELSFLHLIDWSVKSQVELQCQPATALQADDDDFEDARMQQQAMRSFASGFSFAKIGAANDEPVRTSSSLVWHEALLFWQHPAIYSLKMVDESTSQKRYFHVGKDEVAVGAKAAKKHEKQVDNSVLLNCILPPNRKRQRSLHDTVRTTEACERSESNHIWSTRRKDWQDAFRSLYINWMECIRSLDDDWQDIQAGDNCAFIKRISDTYFYAIDSEQAILFRVGIATTGEGQERVANLVPEIVMSASTLIQRQSLRAFGVHHSPLDRTIAVIPDFGDTVNCNKAQTGGFSLSMGNNKNDECSSDEMSPNVKAELIAMRRAQVLGQTAGADVRVTIRPKLRQKTAQKQVYALLVTGTDDCAAFFELYMNSCGRVETKETVGSSHRQLDCDVPLLLCRKLGPFLNASIKKVQLDKSGSAISPHDESVSFDMSGYLLPCAVRDLVCAAVTQMQGSARRSKPLDESDADDYDEVGSHHLLLRTVTLAEGESTRLATGDIKTSRSSRTLNGDWTVVKHRELFGCDTEYCRANEAMTLAAWDITRPNAIAFKIDGGSTAR